MVAKFNRPKYTERGTIVATVAMVSSVAVVQMSEDTDREVEIMGVPADMVATVIMVVIKDMIILVTKADPITAEKIPITAAKIAVTLIKRVPFIIGFLIIGETTIGMMAMATIIAITEVDKTVTVTVMSMGIIRTVIVMTTTETITDTIRVVAMTIGIMIPINIPTATIAGVLDQATILRIVKTIITETTSKEDQCHRHHLLSTTPTVDFVGDRRTIITTATLEGIMTVLLAERRAPEGITRGVRDQEAEEDGA